MTKLQRRKYKAGNQMRKQRILFFARNVRKQDRGYWAKTIGVGQDGKRA